MSLFQTTFFPSFIFIGLFLFAGVWKHDTTKPIPIEPEQPEIRLNGHKPNIILLMAEDISTDLECYGMKAVKTPHLNRLARGGIQYLRAYCTNPICSPSRSAMMVGVHQQKINAEHHRGNRDLPLPDPYKPMTYWLRKAGYTTILGHSKVMGKGRKIDCNFKFNNIGEWDGKENFGLFDRYDIISPEDQPFFAQIQLQVSHRGDWWEEVREKSVHPVDPHEIKLPTYIADHPVIRKDWATYLDQIEFLDDEVGMLIRELKDKELYENTVIIFVGDNGRCNIRGKGYLAEPGIHIPMIISWPEEIREGKVNRELVSTLDIPATILDIAGVSIPDYMDGSSLLSDSFHREFVYSSRDRWDDFLDKSRSIVTRKYKYIRNDMPEIPYDGHHPYLEFHRPALHVMRNLKIDDELSPEERLFFNQTKPREELYDLINDPEELVNLARNPEYSQVLDQLRNTLKQAEKSNIPDEQIYHPTPSKSGNILKFVQYKHPNAYLRMLQGEHIGYQSYVKLYQKQHREAGVK